MNSAWSVLRVSRHFVSLIPGTDKVSAGSRASALSSESGNSFEREVLAGNEQTLNRTRSARISSQTRKALQRLVSSTNGEKSGHNRYCGLCSLFTVRTIRNTDTVRTSQGTHYVSTTEPNRLILFGETVAVYCENT
jgi:hypothetical protein